VSREGGALSLTSDGVGVKWSGGDARVDDVDGDAGAPRMRCRSEGELILGGDGWRRVPSRTIAGVGGSEWAEMSEVVARAHVVGFGMCSASFGVVIGGCFMGWLKVDWVVR